MQKIELGDRVKDKISGLSGIAFGITNWLYGCRRVSVMPEESKDGKPAELFSVDEPQLEIVQKGAIQEKEKASKEKKKKTSGGPMPEVSRQIFVSNMESWEFMSRWYDELASPSYTPDDAVKAKVTELTDNLTTDEEKIAAIFYFVSNDIRYVETKLSGRKAGYKPEPAGVTYANRYGVCRDKAALMVSMLRTAGIPSPTGRSS